MLAPLSPFEAYRSDLDRFSKRSEFGNADTVWLLLAHCLGRLSRVGDGVREQLAIQSAEALRDLMEATGSVSADQTGHNSDLRLIVAGLAVIDSRSGADAVSRACRGFAARMAEAGALSVAYSVLGYARAAVVQASDRERGLLAADQARVARQLGELETADELYRVAALIGDRSSDQELQARASLGRGVLARVRGNYPKARVLFQNGLQLAITSQAQELQYYAHQGLTITTAMTGDYEASLEHGWAAFRMSEEDATKESESLTNLAQVCLLSGYPRAALRSFLSALSRTTVLRVRLSALGGAALAAGQIADRQRLDRLANETRETVERSSLPFENAQALQHLASAYLACGDDVSAERFRQETLAIARAKGFHELEMTSERMEIARVASQPAPRDLHDPTRELVSTLEVFEPESDESAFVLTRSG
jgi:tetratricopeptide (TPR) repeat protein